MRASRISIYPLLAAALAAAPAAAQQVDGVLADARSNDLIARATVVLTDSAGADVASAVTARDGRFRLRPPAAGTYRIRAELDGERLADGTVPVSPEGVTDVTVWIGAGAVAAAARERNPDAVTLAPVEVVSERQRKRLALAGYYDRKRTASGLFLTGAQLTARGGARMSDAISGLRGVVVRPVGPNGFSIQQSRNGRRCNVPLLIDGILVSPRELNGIHPEDVEAIEVYARSDVPLQFRQTYGGPSGCGAVLLWLKLAENEEA
jgi:hypothetical protein